MKHKSRLKRWVGLSLIVVCCRCSYFGIFSYLVFFFVFCSFFPSDTMYICIYIYLLCHRTVESFVLYKIAQAVAKRRNQSSFNAIVATQKPTAIFEYISPFVFCFNSITLRFSISFPNQIWFQFIFVLGCWCHQYFYTSKTITRIGERAGQKKKKNCRCCSIGITLFGLFLNINSRQEDTVFSFDRIKQGVVPLLYNHKQSQSYFVI